jgi:hypothetical protein
LGFPFKIKIKKMEKGAKTSVKGNIQWSKKGPCKELEISSSSMKRIGNVAHGVYSSSKRTGQANKWKQELKEGYNRKGDLCFQNR